MAHSGPMPQPMGRMLADVFKQAILVRLLHALGVEEAADDALFDTWGVRTAANAMQTWMTEAVMGVVDANKLGDNDTQTLGGVVGCLGALQTLSTPLSTVLSMFDLLAALVGEIVKEKTALSPMLTLDPSKFASALPLTADGHVDAQSRVQAKHEMHKAALSKAKAVLVNMRGDLDAPVLTHLAHAALVQAGAMNTIRSMLKGVKAAKARKEGNVVEGGAQAEADGEAAAADMAESVQGLLATAFGSSLYVEGGSMSKLPIKTCVKRWCKAAMKRLIEEEGKENEDEEDEDEEDDADASSDSEGVVALEHVAMECAAMEVPAKTNPKAKAKSSGNSRSRPTPTPRPTVTHFPADSEDTKKRKYTVEIPADAQGDSQEARGLGRKTKNKTATAKKVRVAVEAVTDVRVDGSGMPIACRVRFGDGQHTWIPQNFVGNWGSDVWSMASRACRRVLIETEHKVHLDEKDAAGCDRAGCKDSNSVVLDCSHCERTYHPSCFDFDNESNRERSASTAPSPLVRELIANGEVPWFCSLCTASGLVMHQSQGGTVLVTAKGADARELETTSHTVKGKHASSIQSWMPTSKPVAAVFPDRGTNLK